jgi:hypothetical protein
MLVKSAYQWDKNQLLVNLDPSSVADTEEGVREHWKWRVETNKQKVQWLMKTGEMESSHIHLAAGKTPISWSNGLNGDPSSKVILSWLKLFRSEAKGA